MKQGVKPTRKQRQRLEALGLRSESWTVAKNLPDKMIVIHKDTGRVREVPK